MSKRALISGAGIAGLTAAYWLSEFGWEVVVLEKAPTLRRGEFVIDFAGTGWDVAVKMGIAAQIRERRSQLNLLRFEDGEGKVKASIKMPDFVKSMGVEGKHASINRWELQNLLYGLIESRVEIRYSTSIFNFQENDDGVVVQFEHNGPDEIFDLVVGADGLHSNVRRLGFGPDSDFERYLGYHVAAFRAKGVASEEPGVMRLLRVPSRQAGVLNLGDGDSLALFVYAHEHNAYIPRAERKALLREKFGEMGSIIPASIESIDEDTALYLDTVTQIDMPKWRTRRVALIGDAAYCMTLVSGQGASMAMGGAYVLAEALRDEDDIAGALESYEARLRPFVEGLQDQTRRMAPKFVPAGNFGLRVTEWGMWSMNFSWVRALAATQISIKSLFEVEEQS